MLQQAPTQTTNPSQTVDTAQALAQLRSQLERTQAAYVSTIMEKNFLKRAMADLNFHHNAHDGIVFTDVQNRVVYANPYFLTMMQINDPAELLGKLLPGYMWHSPEDSDKLFNDVRENGFVRERELNLYNQKKEPVFVACSSVASKDDDGNFIGTEIMLCNVTSKRRIQVQLGERTAKLERVTEFTRHSLEHLTELVQRQAERTELLTILGDMQKELSHTLE